MKNFHYELLHVDKHSKARLARLTTLRGVVDLPTFMPVGTLGTVKGCTMEQVKATGAQIVLGNTYHLSLRPGDELVAELGGLNKFSHWDGPMLTDSGGFQIFSLAKLAKVDEQGVSFRSHIDGSLLELTPEKSMAIQRNLGSTIAMVLDHLPPLPSPPNVIRESCERTLRWAGRCRDTKTDEQAMFGIVQGGLDLSLREHCAKGLVELDFDGYAVGGLSVGEPPPDMYRVTAATTPHLPHDRPRYLMGVGRPEDLLACIARGIDMFDCVMPTRNGRNSMAFTDDGSLKIRNAKHRSDPRPLDENTPSPLRHFSRAYLRHLAIAGEMLGPIALSLHNLAYYQHLMTRAREAIAADCFVDFCRERYQGWGREPSEFLE